MREIFETRALRKRRQTGGNSSAVRVLTPPLRLTLLFGLGLAGMAALWSVLSRVPVDVDGTGVLLPVGVLNSLRARVDGVAHWTFADSDYPWEQDALDFQRQPERFSDDEVLDLAQRILGSYIPSQTSNDLAAQRGYGPDYRKYQEGKLLMWLRSLSERQTLQKQVDELVAIGRQNRIQQATLEKKVNNLRLGVMRRQSYLKAMESLLAKGFVEKPALLQEQSEVDNLKSSLFETDDSLVKLQTEVLEQSIKLRQSLAQSISDGMIFADSDLFIRLIVPNDGAGVKSGDELMLISRKTLREPNQVPVFLSSAEAAQVNKGMKVLLTPVGFRRSEVGGILGEVVSISELPSSQAEVQSRIGVQSLANVITKREPSPTMAVIQLERSSHDRGGNRAGYVWNSNIDMPFPPKPADELTVTITTRRVAPIALVIPRLRRWFGFSPPEDKKGVLEIVTSSGGN